MSDADYLIENECESPCYCDDCRVLQDALLNAEQRCREAEDDRIHSITACTGKDTDQLAREERAYQAKLNELERQRNLALDALSKHQRLKH